MSTVIKATCNQCDQDVRLTPSDVTLRFIAETEFEQAQYRFICPLCKKIAVKPASQEIATLLYGSAVNVERYELPLELLERPRADEKPIISIDDVLDLGLALEQDEEGWFEKMKRKFK